MTDVVTRASGEAPVYNNRVTVFSPGMARNRSSCIKSYGHNDVTHISGYNAQETSSGTFIFQTNGPLDQRFDNPTYY